VIDLDKKRQLISGLRVVFQEIPLKAEERSRYLIDLLYGGLRYELGADEARSTIMRLIDEAETRRRESHDQFDS
jgi:hypothetical protein